MNIEYYLARNGSRRFVVGNRCVSSLSGWGETSHDYKILDESLSKVYGHRRTSIEYKIGQSSKRAHVRTCELDALTVLNVCSKSDRLFSTLLSKGIFSYLIWHFGNCESLGLRYTIPGSKVILFWRDQYNSSMEKGSDSQVDSSCSVVVEDEAEEKQVESQDSLCSEMYSQYRLYGGKYCYYWIMENDPMFFKGLYQGMESDVCSVKRLDVCADHSEDLMDLVSEDVKKGKVRGIESRLRGFGVANNKRFGNMNVGWKSLQNSLLREYVDFRINTLYCGGGSSNSNCMVVFYDKKEQLCSTKSEQYLDNTRIEIRLWARSKENKYAELIDALFYSISLRRESGKGQHLRHTIFTGLLFSHICFTKNRFPKGGMFKTLSSWSPWYRELFKVYMIGCFDLSGSGSKERELDEKLILSLLGKLKRNPARMSDFVKLFCTKLWVDRSYSSVETDKSPWVHATQRLAGLRSPIQGDCTTSGTLSSGQLETAVFTESTESGKAKRGRPRGSKDSRKFANRGRPRKKVDKSSE